MRDFLFISLSILLVSFKSVINEVQYSDSFIAFYDGQADEKNFIHLEENGYVLDKKLDIAPGFYRFIRNETRTRTRIAPPKQINQEELQRKDPKLLSFKQERLWFREKKSTVKVEDKCFNRTSTYQGFDIVNRSKRALTISDRSWNRQWHLNPGHTPSMGVYNAWESGYTGRTVTVAIVDDGIDVFHSDLLANYNSALSFDVINDVRNPSHRHFEEGHGTKCAGVVAAVKNTDCVIGTAYQSSIVAIRLLDKIRGSSDSEEASALVHQLANIDIYSNSWGDPDDGKDFDSALPDVQQSALLQGVLYGRGGKGAIYVWAAGNGGQKFDDCNVDGYVGSIYTIAVNSLAPDSSAAYYAEHCTSVLVATYGGDFHQDTIATTGRYSSCEYDFQGTSAACPLAAGIIALVLQANPDLTWRDIQHMIVEYSTNTGLRNANFYTNGAGKKVSLTHGFGLMNASKMVNAASGWKTVPTYLLYTGSTTNYNRYMTGIGSFSSTYFVNDRLIKYLEHVVVTIYFKAKYREYTSIYLVSPEGTSSRLLRERRYDLATSSVTWSFMSVHTWGENPAGTWTLRMQSSDIRNHITLYTWKLSFYGTATNPLAGRPLDGDNGGYCDSSVTCKGAESYCLRNAQICVICQAGHHVVDGNCLQDGSFGGFCNGSSFCLMSSHRCNLATNRCVSCDNGYHVISGRCIQDGEYGGYCDSRVTCKGAESYCLRNAQICVICQAGHHVIDGNCLQDGSFGGFCNGSSVCLMSSHRCNLATNRCVSCDNGYHVISGRCIQDGVLGGYCDSNTTCVVAGTGCRKTSLTCVTCGVGYRLIGNFCEQDGAAGGFCDNSTLCRNTSYNCENNICKVKTGSNVQKNDSIADQDTSSTNHNNIGIIVGASLGGLVVLCIVVAVVIKYVTASAVTPAPVQADNLRPPIQAWGTSANTHFQRY